MWYLTANKDGIEWSRDEMIRVAICDDEHEALQHMEDAIAHYGKQKSLELLVDRFSHAEELNSQIESNRNYQIYVLDMMMPGMDGIEIGHAIRRQDSHAAIIYLTSSMDYAYQAFGVFAQRYLLKPIQENDFHEAMDFAVGNALQQQRALNVNTAHGIHRILYNEIEYIENAARALHIFTTDGNEIVSRLLRKSFESDMCGILSSQDFIQSHKSFIVNLSHIKLYGTSQITMRSGAKIPISKSRQAKVKRAYLKYISEGY